MKKPHIRKGPMFWEVIFPAQPDPICPELQFQWIPAWCMEWKDVSPAIAKMAKHMPTWAVAGQVPQYFSDNLPASVRRA